MKKETRLGWGVLGLLVFAAATLRAEGLRTLPDSARAMGMVGGRLATLDDASVVRTNPATLVDLLGTEAQVNVQILHGTVDFDGAFGGQGSMIDPWKLLGSVHLAHPVDERLAFGFGISAPFGIAVSWEPEGPFRYTGAHEASLRTLALNPAVALRLNDHVSLGAGLDLYHSTLELQQRYPWGPLLAAPLPDGTARFRGEGWGAGGYLSVNWDFAERQRLAFAGRLPVSVDYRGSFRIDGIPAPGLALPETPFRSEIEHPGSFGIGYRLEATERLTLGIDFEWLGNSSHDVLPLMIGANQPLLGGADAVPLAWKDTVTAGFGLSYQCTEALVLRAGYQFAEAPLSSRTYHPSLPANDRHSLSVGVGYTRGRNTIDLAYTRLLMADSVVNGNLQPAFDGSYRHAWDAITVSFTRRF